MSPQEILGHLRAGGRDVEEAPGVRATPGLGTEPKHRDKGRLAAPGEEASQEVRILIPCPLKKIRG